VDIADDGESTLMVSSSDPARLVSLLIRHQRDSLAMSLAEVAAATGAKSRNGWAQYEQGVHEPSPSKLQRMLDAVDSGLVVAVIPRTARVLPREDQTGMEELVRFIDDPSPETEAAMRAKLTKRVVYTSSKKQAKPAAVRAKPRARRASRAKLAG
jgi:transcriptional regulator with XRE-family HTH domain